MPSCWWPLRKAFQALHDAHPVSTFLTAIDDHLNEVGYIIQGLGDAGDKILGPNREQKHVRYHDHCHGAAEDPVWRCGAFRCADPVRRHLRRKPVLVPLLTGLNPSLALLGAGIGTLVFQVCWREVPIISVRALPSSHR